MVTQASNIESNNQGSKWKMDAIQESNTQCQEHISDRRREFLPSEPPLSESRYDMKINLLKANNNASLMNIKKISLLSQAHYASLMEINHPYTIVQCPGTAWCFSWLISWGILGWGGRRLHPVLCSLAVVIGVMRQHLYLRDNLPVFGARDNQPGGEVPPLVLAQPPLEVVLPPLEDA